MKKKSNNKPASKSKRAQIAENGASAEAKSTKSKAAKATKTKSGKAKPQSGKAADTKPMALVVSPEAKKSFNKDCALAKEQITSLVLNDTLGRYELGLIFARLRAGGAYGSNTVDRVAAAIDMAPRTINEHAFVAEAWPVKDTFEKWAKERGANGKPLSWSHFVLASTLDRDEQETFLKKALKGGWTIAQCRAELDEDVDKDKDAADDKSSASDKAKSVVDGGPLAVAINEVAQSLGVLRDSLAKREKEVSDIAGKAEPKDLAAAQAALDEAIRVAKETCDLLDLLRVNIRDSAKLNQSKQQRGGTR